jgi:dihydropteroate synthase
VSPAREAVIAATRRSPVNPEPLVLRAGHRTFELGSRPLLIGIVNASPNSFSDDGSVTTHDQRIRLAAELIAAGADIIDVGGESARTGLAPVPPEQEIERTLPLVHAIAHELGATVSIDTYKPAVAAAALDAGASIVNDVSGLRDPAIAELCARAGAALVLMHTRARPKQRLQDPELYDDVLADTLDFLRTRIERSLQAGMSFEQLLLDPGPDFAKTPAQTIALLASLERLHELERPLLLAISRKDFIGALTARRPRERLAGTLAALAHGLDQGAQVFRLHDIAPAADFIRVRMALRGQLDAGRDLQLAEELRSER